MKINEALTKIIEAFEKGNIPAALAMSTFPKANVPMNKWSFFNRFIARINGTSDARGYQQWKEVGRFIVKGSHAFPILAPRFKKVADEQTGEEVPILSGYIAVAVFRMEDTEGEPLEYQNIELPPLRLMEVAKAFGVTVKPVPGSDDYLGYYSDRTKEIALASKDETVFFHELAHAADYKLRDLKPCLGQKLDREIIAELAACSLAYLVGKELPSTLGNHFRYIETYAEEAKLNTVSACMRYFTETEAVLKEISKHSQLTIEDVVEMESQ